MLKVCICGSWSDLSLITVIRERFESLGMVVTAPSKEWLDYCKEAVKAHHSKTRDQEDFDLTVKKFINMHKYYDFVAKSDLVYVVNIKNGKEHYGVNTTMELGIAHYLGKPIIFYQEPTKMELRLLGLKDVYVKNE